MNFSTFIVKLIENPIQSSFKDNICLTEVLGVISTKFKKQKQKPPLIKITAWGNLSDVLMNYYQKDDLLVIEGIISLRSNFEEIIPSAKFIEITLVSFYPYENEKEEEENSLEQDRLQSLSLKNKSLGDGKANNF